MKNKTMMFSIMIILIMAIILPLKEMANDTFSSIKVGELITNSYLMKIDPFSIHLNLSFMIPHFIFDIIVYLIYNCFSFEGLYILLIILLGILLYTFFSALNKISDYKILNLFFTVLLGITFTGFITLRAQIMSYTLLILTFINIYMFLKENKKRYLLYLVILSYLIINIHAAVWPIYFIIYLPFFANIFKIRLGRIEYDNYKNLKYLLIPIFISIFLPLISPIGINAYTYIYNNTISFNVMKNISEHMSLTMDSQIGKIFFIINISSSLFLIFTKGRIRLTSLLFFLGFSFMSILGVRHISFFLISIFILLMDYLISNYNLNNIKNLNKRIIILILIIIGIVSMRFIMEKKDLDYIDKKIYPIEASKYINENINEQDMRLLNDYNFGSYLIYKDIKVFIDSRCDLYTFNKNITKDYIDMISGNKSYLSIIKEYKITHILTYNNSNLNKLFPLDNNLLIIYIDDYFTIYQVNY